MPNPTNDPTFMVISVTPTLAAAWLALNNNNRRAADRVVARYRADMLEGRWEFAGDPIRFDAQGNLIDGQHRLLALAGCPEGTQFKFLVVRNLPVESVFICQERIFGMGDEEDDGLGQLEPEVGPKLMPSVKNDLNASVSIIGNTFIRLKLTKEKVDGKIKRTAEKQYCLRVGPNQVYTTKIRKPKGIEAPDYIVDPTFRKIKAIMKGNE